MSKYKNISLIDWCIQNNRKEILNELNMDVYTDVHNLVYGQDKPLILICSNCKMPYDTTIRKRVRKKNSLCTKCSRTMSYITSSDIAGSVNKKRLQDKLLKEGSLGDNRPDLLDEWDYELNGEITPFDVTIKSNLKVNWICQKGHKYKTPIKNRTSHKIGCPYCTHQKAIIGVNDLATVKPDLVKEWDYDKNIEIKIEETLEHSNKKVWWKCSKCGYEYKTTVANRSNGTGCPCCANKVVVDGINDLNTLRPDLIKEWDYEKNEKGPNSFTIGSGKYAWWKCSKGHSWKAVISSRTSSGRGCPYCSGRKPIVGENDLATLRPDIAKEWDYERNNKNPNDFSCGSREPIWWKCSKGHSYKQIIIKRTVRGYNCPYCSNEIVLKGFNDLATVNPRLAKEWDYEKNKTTPDMYTSGSSFNAWWICPIGHKYKTKIVYRTTKGGTNCPICNKRNSSSFPEQAIYYYVKKLYPNAVNKYKDIFKNSMELDIYIPDIKLGIEFDGANWHKTEKQHKSELKKYTICKNNNIYLIRVKENNGTNWKDTFDSVYVIDIVKKTNELESVIQAILDSIDKESNMWNRKKPIFHSSIKVDLEKDRYEIMNYLSEIENSLAKERPDIVEKWNYEKNKGLTPYMFSVGSSKKVWWKCPTCGNEWECSINSMTRKGRYGCAICSNIQKGKTFTLGKVKEKGSLADNNPKLAKEWHPTKNGSLTPNDITEGRFKPVWWLCSKCGYEWQQSPNNRKRGMGCPCCSGRVPKIGVNDLETWCIENGKEYILKDWDYKKNKKSPSQYLPFSGQKVNWKCSICGYEWATIINSRTKDESKCPNCFKRKITYKNNDLATLRPDIAKEWDYNKNTLKPYEVGCSVNNKIWWICPNGHSYQMRVASRTGKNRNGKCPYCSNKKILIGYNDLQTTHPDVAKEWHSTKNKPLKPTDVTRGNGKKIWWKCSKGHEWKATVLARTSGNNCPYCSGHKPLRGYNDLVTSFPEVARYWDTNSNSLLPTEVLPHSEMKAFWVCPNCNTKWQAKICDMVKRKNKCFNCANIK